MTSAEVPNSGTSGTSVAQLAPSGSVRDPRDLYGVGRYPLSPTFEEDSFASTLREYLRIFKRRKWLILSIAAACLAVGALKTLIQTPLYSSTVRLQIDRNVAKVMEGGSVTPVEGQDLEFLKTQYELLQSRNLAERVVSAARLTEDKSFLKSAGSSLLGPIKSLFDNRTPHATTRVFWKSKRPISSSTIERSGRCQDRAWSI